MLFACMMISCDSSQEKGNEEEDIILPVRNSLGDTVETGITKEVTGKVTLLDTLNTVKILSKAPIVESAHPNVYPTPDPFIKHIAVPDTLNIDHSVILQNKQEFLGDTVSVSHPETIKATTTKFKDAAVFNMSYLGPENGLFTSFVSTVTEDSKGNVWLANGGVLAKHNGANISYYSKKEGFSDFYIWAVIEALNGDIWIATDGGGVLRYNGEYCIHYTRDNGLLSNSVVSLKEDSKGNIWIGMNTSGIQMFDGNNLVTVSEKEGFVYLVNAITEDDRGNIWLGSYNGLIKFDGTEYYLFDESKGMKDKSTRSLTAGKNGEVWIGTNHGFLIKFNGYGFVNYSFDSCRGNIPIRSLLETKEGDVWLGTMGNGVIRFNEKEVTYYTIEEGLAHNNVWWLYEDKLDNLWIGTDGGANYFEYSSYSQYTVDNGLGDNFVWEITSDNKGDLWMATHTGGVNVYSGSHMFTYNTEHGLLHNHCRSIFKDSNGNIWIGSSYGLTMYDGVYFHHYDNTNGFVKGLVVTIFEDSGNNLWFGTQGFGAIKFDGEKFTQYSEEQGLSSVYVFSIGEDSDNNIWLGTFEGGLNKLDSKEENVTIYSTKEGVSNNIIWYMDQLPYGELAIGTKTGLDVWSGNSFSHFLISDIDVKGEIQGFDMDQNDKIWVTTDKGLFVSESPVYEDSSKTLKSSISMISMNKEDGLKDANFLQNSIFIDDSNFFWAGNGKGLVSIDIANFKSSIAPPVVSINNIELKQNHLNYNNKESLIEKGIVGVTLNSSVKFQNVPEGLTLPYDVNHLTFHFSATDWNAPGKIRYSFRVKGLEKDWSLPSKETKVDYRNLSQGDYTFQVKAIGESDKWSGTSEFSFTITPPFWLTWWAVTVYILLGVLCIYLLIRWETFKLKLRQEELELEVNRATEKIRNQKELVEEKNKEILDSMEYAKRIQSAILPPIKLVKEYLKDSFILYFPKDIVAGDFYWMETSTPKSQSKGSRSVLFAVADCTGHGVPGAMVSVVCNNALNRSVREFNLTLPAQILDKTREIVIEEFGKSEDEVMDGMDIAMCRIDGLDLWYSGANNPIWIIRDNEIIEYKADKQPIGKYRRMEPFKESHIKLKKGDMLYLFSDGYADQFGGHKGKKMKSTNFKKLLLSICNNPVEKQALRLTDAFDGWKGELEQVDDICIVGLRI